MGGKVVAWPCANLQIIASSGREVVEVGREPISDRLMGSFYHLVHIVVGGELGKLRCMWGGRQKSQDEGDGQNRQ